VTVTACDQVELNGHVDLRFTFRVHNTSAGGIQQFFLEKLDLQGDPADTCSFVASAVPPVSRPPGSVLAANHRHQLRV
jgi:hypothetical protein